jgi:hypothetical protein
MQICIFIYIDTLYPYKYTCMHAYTHTHTHAGTHTAVAPAEHSLVCARCGLLFFLRSEVDYTVRHRVAPFSQFHLHRIRQHTSAYVSSICQHTRRAILAVSPASHASAYVSICQQHTSAYALRHSRSFTCIACISLRQHTSAYASRHSRSFTCIACVSVCQPTSAAYVSIRVAPFSQFHLHRIRQPTSAAYVSIRVAPLLQFHRQFHLQHASAVRQRMSAYVSSIRQHTRRATLAVSPFQIPWLFVRVDKCLHGRASGASAVRQHTSAYVNSIPFQIPLCVCES